MGNTIQDSSMSALMDKMNPQKSGTTKGGTTKTAVQETQDRFMTLLVTQMKNQDPMNPLDNAQVTSQFAQLSTVTGIDKLNDTLGTLMGSYQSSQTLQAASMIGHGVLSPGGSIDLVKGSALLGVDLPTDADKVTVTIHDAKGVEVRRLDLGAQKAGSLPVTWDGKAADGSVVADGHYTFELAATSGGAKVDATALQFGLVDSVSTNSKGVKLNVTGMGALDLASVRQIL